MLWQLVFNLNDPVVGDRFMRTALALITDPDQLAADSVGFDDPLSASADSRVFAQGQQVPGAPAASPTVYNPVRAAALFKLLGYTPDEYGVLRAYGTGSPLTLTITGPRGNGVIDALELQLQAEWASCGVGLIIHNVPIDDLLKTALPQGRYQLALAPYVMPVFPTWDSIIYTDPVLPMRISFPPNLGMLVVGPGGPVGRSPGLTTGGTWPWSLPTPVGTEPGATSVGAVTRNVTGLEDPQVAVYLEKITGELNADKQYQLLSKLDTLLTQDLPTLPLFQAPVSLVQQADIVNVSESAGSAGPLWDAEDWVVELASANS